jgi:thymidine phosphorylase
VRKTYDFDFFKVRRLARYGWIMDRSAAVVIVPIAPDDRIWLLKIDRPPTGTRSWEFPGGGVDKGEDPVSAGAGVVMHAKPGDQVVAGEPLLTLHTDDPERFAAALEALSGAYDVGVGQPAGLPLVIERIDAATA